MESKDFKSTVVSTILKNFENVSVGSTKDKDVTLSVNKGNEGTKAILQMRLFGCFDDIKYNYHLFSDEKSKENEGLMTCCFKEGDGLTVKMTWLIPDGNAQKQLEKQQQDISESNNNKEILQPSSVETTGHENRPGMVAATTTTTTSTTTTALKSVKCNIDQLTISFQQAVAKDVIDDIGESMFESEIKKALACTVVAKIKQQLLETDDILKEMISKGPASSSSSSSSSSAPASSSSASPSSKTGSRDMKPSGKWTYEWNPAVGATDTDEKIKLSQEKFQQVFVPAARRH